MFGFLSSKRSNILSLFVVVMLGCALRLAWLDQLPHSMNRDELSIAYNAFSLVETGKDERGVGLWPVTFRAFGEYKLPGLIYITAAAFRIMGQITPFVARLPTALAACATLLLIAVFTHHVWRSVRITLSATLLLSLAFWHIANARSIFEPMVALPFFLLALLCLLWARTRTWWLLGSVACFFVSGWIYNSSLILYPLVFGSFVWLHRRQLSRSVVVCASVALIACWATLFLTFAPTNRSRSYTTIFVNPNVQAEISRPVHLLALEGKPLWLSRLLNNKVTVWGWTVLEKYLSVWNPTFLFFRGDSNAWHNLNHIHLGNLNLFSVPFVGVALVFAWRQRKHLTATERWLVVLFFLTPLPSAISVDSPITNRLMEFHVLWEVMAAWGAYMWWQKIKRQPLITQAAWYVTWFGYVVLALWGISKYFMLYNLDLPEAWQPYTPELVRRAQQYISQVNAVVISPEIDMAYLPFVFYTRFAPKEFQRTAQWKIETFHEHATAFGPYVVGHLSDVVFPDDSSGNNDKRQVLVITTPSDHMLDQYARMTLMDTVVDRENRPLYFLYMYHPPQSAMQ